MPLANHHPRIMIQVQRLGISASLLRRYNQYKIKTQSKALFWSQRAWVQILILLLVSCMRAYVPSCFSHVQLFATLWSAARQAALSMGFSKQEYQNGLSCPPLGDLPDPGMEPASPALQADSFLLSHRGSPISYVDLGKLLNPLYLKILF